MSQFTPSPEYLPPQPQRTNVPAITSLVTGLLSCVPLISIVAVITGIMGLKKTKDPAVGGRGMAIAGLILGSIGVLWTIAAVGLVIAGRHVVQNAMNSPAHAIAKQFVADVASGDAKTVYADCDSSVDPTKVEAIVADAKKWGTLTDSTLIATPSIKGDDGQDKSVVAGVAVYANAKKAVTVTVINASAAPKVVDFTFQDQAGPVAPPTNAP